jgi:hypothetical protein
MSQLLAKRLFGLRCKGYLHVAQYNLGRSCHQKAIQTNARPSPDVPRAFRRTADGLLPPPCTLPPNQEARRGRAATKLCHGHPGRATT